MTVALQYFANGQLIDTFPLRYYHRERTDGRGYGQPGEWWWHVEGIPS